MAKKVLLLDRKRSLESDSVFVNLTEHLTTAIIGACDMMADVARAEPDFERNSVKKDLAWMYESLSQAVIDTLDQGIYNITLNAEEVNLLRVALSRFVNDLIAEGDRNDIYTVEAITFLQSLNNNH